LKTYDSNFLRLKYYSACVQVCGFKALDLSNLILLANLVLAQQQLSGGEVEENTDSNRGLKALITWADGWDKILGKAWLDYRILTRNNLSPQKSVIKVLCYSQAQKIPSNEDLNFHFYRNDTNDWAALYPVSKEAVVPYSYWHSDEDGTDDESDEAEKDESGKNKTDDDDSEEDSWTLSPRLAIALFSALSEFDDDCLVSKLPAMAKLFASMPAFIDNLQNCATRLASRIAMGMGGQSSLPNCTGEKLMLHLAMSGVDYYLDNDDDSSLELPYSKHDRPTSDTEECLMEDAEDVRELYSDSNPNSTYFDHIGADCLHPAEWFIAFNPDRFTDHIDFSPNHRRRMQTRAAILLTKSTTCPATAWQCVVAKLRDSDLMRVCCCAKLPLLDDAKAED
jgi:hypothetical protein